MPTLEASINRMAEVFKTIAEPLKAYEFHKDFMRIAYLLFIDENNKLKPDKNLEGVDGFRLFAELTREHFVEILNTEEVKNLIDEEFLSQKSSGKLNNYPASFWDND